MRVRRFLKFSFVVLPLLLLGTYSVHEVAANSAGIIGQSKVGCGGGGCHGSKSSATVISLTTTATQIVTGQSYIFRLSVANPSEAGAGCDISVDNGAKLGTSGTGLFAFNNELTHNGPRTFTGDSAVWNFKYTAPTKAGTAHIYVAGNAVNLNGTNDLGDHWNTLVYTVNVVSPAAVDQPANTVSVVVSPNPARGVFQISATGMSGSATAQLMDAAGRVILTKQIDLSQSSSIDASTLTRGSYFVMIQPEQGERIVRKVVLQ